MKIHAWDLIGSKLSSFIFQKGIASFVNPYSMLKLVEHPEVVENIDFWYVDGISLVNQINYYQENKIQRYSFDDTSLAPVVFAFALKNNIKIAIIGTKKDLIQRAVLNIQSKHHVKIDYFHHGYYESKEDIIESYKVIVSKNINLVICGMGTPNQENFLIGLKNYGWSGYGFTCGGYLHQVATAIKNYYPKYFDYLNIRWVYRIIDEPKLFKRYSIDYPKFFFYYFLVNFQKRSKQT